MAYSGGYRIAEVEARLALARIHHGADAPDAAWQELIRAAETAQEIGYRRGEGFARELEDLLSEDGTSVIAEGLPRSALAPARTAASRSTLRTPRLSATNTNSPSTVRRSLLQGGISLGRADTSGSASSRHPRVLSDMRDTLPRRYCPQQRRVVVQCLGEAAAGGSCAYDHEGNVADALGGQVLFDVPDQPHDQADRIRDDLLGKTGHRSTPLIRARRGAGRRGGQPGPAEWSSWQATEGGRLPRGGAAGHRRRRRPSPGRTARPRRAAGPGRPSPRWPQAVR